MLDKLMDFISEHKAVATVGITFVMFAVFGIVQSVIDHQDGETPPVQEEVQEGASSGAGSAGGGTGGFESTAPSETQKAVAENATDDMKEFMSNLETVTWTEETGHGLLRFKNGSFEVKLPSDGGDEKPVTKRGYVAISSLEDSPITPQVEDGDQLALKLATVIDQEGSAHVLYFGRYLPVGAVGNPVLYVSCDLFGESAWTSERNYKTLKLEQSAKKSPALKKAFHGKLKEVEKELSEWAAANCTLGATAFWDGRLTYDENAGTVTAAFSIPDPTSSDASVELARVQAVWISEKNGFEIEKGVPNE
ncbi:MAG: hypothetical protein Q4B30_06945 [Coriobacteriaceae bacterium]|nr:hypothetical protein [Coriobacteriaceae bacterium]